MTKKWNVVCREINDVTVNKIPRALNTSPNVHTSEREVFSMRKRQRCQLIAQKLKREAVFTHKEKGCNIFAHLKLSYGYSAMQANSRPPLVRFCSTETQIAQSVTGKSELAPENCRQTVPRLELLGILIDVILAKNTFDNIEIIDQVKSPAIAK